MELLGDFLEKRKQQLVLKPSSYFPLNSEIGVEVELENVRAATGLDLSRWAFKEDHSLHDRGLEFVFKGPMFGEDVILALDNLLEIAKSNGYTISQRTGIHVHLDSRDMSRQQLIGLLAYYCMFEPCIYNWVGDQREANNFCLPYYKAISSLEQVQAIIKSLYIEATDAVSKKVIKTTTSAYHRYAGLNLKSLVDFGSLEFRHLKTTLDRTRILDWINIIYALKNAALKIPESTSHGILHDIVNRGPKSVAREVFSPEFISRESLEALFYKDFEDDFYQYGYPNAAYLLDFADKVRKIGQRERMPWESSEDPWSISPKKEDKPKSHKAAMKLRASLYPKDQPPSPEEEKEFLARKELRGAAGRNRAYAFRGVAPGYATLGNYTIPQPQPLFINNAATPPMQFLNIPAGAYENYRAQGILPSNTEIHLVNDAGETVQVVFT